MRAAIPKSITGFLVLLSTTLPAWAQFGVNCPGSSAPPGFGTHPTIQAAVDAASAAGPTLILISGNCVENVVVNGKHDLTIKKPGPAPVQSLTGASTAQSVLTILNAQNFSVIGVSISGISDGDPTTNSSAISLRHSTASVQGCVVQNAERNGISVTDDSSLTLEGSTVQNSGGNGLDIANDSSASVNNSAVQDNGGNGINATNMSAVALNNTNIRNNVLNGLLVVNSSLATLSGDFTNTPAVEKVEITRNGTNGINVGGLSNLVGTGVHLIHENGSSGIAVGGGSAITLTGQSATARIQIYNNGGSGLVLARSIGNMTFGRIYQNNQSLLPSTSVVCGVCAFPVSSTLLIGVEVSADPGHGLFLSSNSVGTVRSVSIVGNTGEGIHVERASGVTFLPDLAGIPTNVSGNIGGSLNCPDNLSWSAGDLTGVAKPIKCTELK